MNIVPVVLSGGSGSRLWPLSREHYPKQLIALCGEHTMLQSTLIRLHGLERKRSQAGQAITLAPALVVANEAHRFTVADQLLQEALPFSHIVLEPIGRNTAPALTLAALALAQDGDPLMMVMPADHNIADIEAFHRALIEAGNLAEQGQLVTFGVVPDEPETGYGYIKVGDALQGTAHHIAAFVEKPNLADAQRYLDSGQYLWNSGMFMMRASVWLKAIETFQPQMLAACREAADKGVVDQDFFRIDRAAFEACPSDSIDYAVMEHLAGANSGALTGAVVPLDAKWSDVGAWSSLWHISDKDQNGNVIEGDVYTQDSRNNLILAKNKLVATVGVEDLVVVETADAVMVAHKDRAQDVKKIVEQLNADGRTHTKLHRRVYRPWGAYDSIDNGERFQVKRITVNPGAALSLQMHHHRAEHWIVVKGTAKVTRGDEQIIVTENQSTYIPLGVKHRLENPGSIPLELIEVQSGSYLGEDDIVRYEDVYGR